MILIALAIFGCIVLVGLLVAAWIKWSSRKMDEQNKEMETYLKQYEDTKKSTGRGGKSAGR